MRHLAVFALVAFAWGCPSKDEPAAPAAPKPPPTASEAEPNDDAKSAQALGVPVRVKSSWKAGKKADGDWFKIEPPHPTLLRIEISGTEGVAPTLTVYDAAQNVKAHTSGAPGKATVLPNLLCEKSCFVEAKADGTEATGDYTLSVDVKVPGEHDEKEPNGRFVDVQKLGANSELEGYLHPSDDQDWYLVDTSSLTADQVLGVKLTPPADVRAHLEVLRPSDQSPLGEWRAVDTGAPVHVRNIRPSEGESGVLLIVQNAWVRNDAGKSVRLSNPNDAYTLKVEALSGAPDLETEPNDEAARATPIEPSTPRTGHLSPKGDTDWFTFEVEGSSIVHAELTGVEGVDLELSAVDPEKLGAEKDDELARAHDGEVSEGEIISNVVVPPGRNYLRVRGEWKKIDERWVRDFADYEKPYTLSFEVLPDDGTIEHEPNAKADQASTLQVGRAHRGWIHPAKDVDLWKLELAAPANVVLDLSAVPKLDLSITVRDATRPAGDGAALIGSVDRLKVEGAERLVVPFEAGAWLVEIREKGRNANAARPYVLSVK